MYYFIGIKGSGMASLAEMLYDLGYEVMGSDLKKHFLTEDALRQKGIKILEFNKDNIKDNYTVIIGNAFLEDFDEVVAARKNPTCKCYRYHEFLGELMKKYCSITISGSHGKTTTTTMAKTVFGNFFETGYLIGDGTGYLNKNSEYLCVEACEYRNHFHAYYPDYAIITNIEIDHVDFFKSEEEYFNAYQEFIKNVKKACFYYGDDPWCQKLKFGNLEHYSYGLTANNDYHVENLHEENGNTSFDLYFKDIRKGSYNLPFIGRHLLIDALSVISLATHLKLDSQKIEDAFMHYHGPKRRYVVEEYKNAIFIDDYAHHPTEVKVTLETTRLRYPNRKIIAVFKPHRASRVLHFADDFKKALEIADKIYLIDFSSIDDKQDGTDIDITYLANKIDRAIILPEDKNGAKMLAEDKDGVFVFMSSKDIYNIANWTKEYL